MRPFLLKFGWLLAFLTVAAFFLPWVKLETAAFNRVAERQRVANQLEADAGLPWYQRLIGLRPEDVRKALSEPLAGESGLAVVQAARDTANLLARQKAHNIAGAFGLSDLRAVAIVCYAIPALAVLGMVLLTVGFGSRLPVLFGGAASVGLYFLVRWRIDETFLDRTVLGIAPGIGLWLSLYGLALLGLLLLLDAVLPEGHR